MNTRAHPGPFRRWLTALGGGALGRSCPGSVKQFCGRDESGDAVRANHPGGQQRSLPGGRGSPGSPHEGTEPTPSPRAWPPGVDWEPVHGWTRRQADTYLTRNPDSRPAYAAEPRKHPGWATSADGLDTPADP